MASRVQDWPTAFTTLLAEKKSAPFSWGKNDCVLFAADCILAITGVDPGEGVRGKYKTAKGAASLMRKRGGLASAIQAKASDLGLARINPMFAQRGDIALVETLNGTTVAVRTADAWVGPGFDGLERIVTMPTVAWAVGRSV